MCYEVLRARHDWFTAEEHTHIIKLEGVRFATEPGGVVDAQTILHE